MVSLKFFVVLFISMCFGSWLGSRWRKEPLSLQAWVQQVSGLIFLFGVVHLIQGNALMGLLGLTELQNHLLYQLSIYSIILFGIIAVPLTFFGPPFLKIQRPGQHFTWNAFLLYYGGLVGGFVFAAFVMIRFASESTAQRVQDILAKFQFPMLIVMFVVVLGSTYLYRKGLSKK